ncbi:MAG TPA: type III-A CRISPR-associated RAMP protein Csm3 [Bryobacteraceae bacterium]|nr:type III-A CRISPR-associated RAMP protein Csm3 [Bryobacteraceae bacterium]
MPIKLMKIHTITGELEVKTGLRIGAGRDTVEIGGIDNPVVKHPHTQQPYIPGSSLKGKLRSLLEWFLEKVEEDGKVWGSSGKFPPGDEVLRIFGTTSDKWKEGPTRVIVRDALLCPDWSQSVVGNGLTFTEEKTEVAIDRIKGKAADMGPRTMERVPAGARFSLEILFKEYSVNDDGGAHDRRCLERLIDSLRLLEQDALGGSGSRGYGKVEVRSLCLDGKDILPQFRAVSQLKREAPTRYLEN